PLLLSATAPTEFYTLSLHDALPISPVMLMDEPFGAIDPITRDKLQDEFLQLQERIKKTIVFVTHDIDEALKLSDRIAIFSEGARSEEHTSELQSRENLVCRLLLEKK